MTLELVLDVGVALLLAATLGYCVLLKRKLGTLQALKVELERTLTEFTRASDQVERGIAGMRRTAEEAGTELQERIGAARALRDELAIVTQLGAALAERIEKRLLGDGDVVSPVTRGAAARKASASDSERELMDMLARGR